MLSGGDPEYRRFLQKEAAALPSGRVIFDAPVPPNRVVETVARHDIGVYLLANDNFNCRHAMPNKFFDFIAAGLPIAVGPSPAMGAMVREHGLGWVAPDFSAKAFGALLESLTAEQIAAARQASLAAREKFNAATETAKLVDLVKRLVPPRNAALGERTEAVTGTDVADAVPSSHADVVAPVVQEIS